MDPILLSGISLAVLIGIIALGFLKKWNVGILSFGAAMLMGMAAGMSQKQIVAGFNTSLFVILIGSMFLFGIAQLNGTMDLLAKKTVALAGRQGWAVPIFMYLLGAVVAALGPGTIPGFGIVAMFGVPLALEMKADPFLFCTIGQMGAIAGGIDLLATGLASIMTGRTAPALISLASGIMSWFSSTSGVVMPTMIPTIPSILEHLGPEGANLAPALMVSAVTVGSSCAGISPASTGGGLIMASLASDLKDHNITFDYNKLFIKLFLTSIFSVMMAVLFALIGGYNFTPYG